jgi:glutamyl-Q tRNA(Asp) synthetase
VVRNAAGEKLSKQTGALAVQPADEAAAVATLLDAARFLGLRVEHAASLAGFWQGATAAWRDLLALRAAA